MRLSAKDVGIGTIVAVVLAISGIIAPILWDKWKSRTQLTVEINSAAEVTSAKRGIDGLEFRYNDVPITHLEQVILTVENTGATSLIASDFIKPISIYIGESTLLDARVLKTAPPGVEVQYEIKQQQLLIMPSLLNSGDLVQLAILTKDSQPNVQVQGRIRGVSSINFVGSEKNRPRRNYFLLILPLLAGTMFILLARTFMKIPGWRQNAVDQIKNDNFAFISSRSVDEAKDEFSKISLLLDEMSRPKLLNWTEYVKWPLDTKDRQKFSDELLSALEQKPGLPQWSATTMAIVSGVVMIGISILGFFGILEVRS